MWDTPASGGPRHRQPKGAAQAAATAAAQNLSKKQRRRQRQREHMRQGDEAPVAARPPPAGAATIRPPPPAPPRRDAPPAAVYVRPPEAPWASNWDGPDLDGSVPETAGPSRIRVAPLDLTVSPAFQVLVEDATAAPSEDSPADADLPSVAQAPPPRFQFKKRSRQKNIRKDNRPPELVRPKRRRGALTSKTKWGSVCPPLPEGALRLCVRGAFQKPPHLRGDIQGGRGPRAPLGQLYRPPKASPAVASDAATATATATEARVSPLEVAKAAVPAAGKKAKKAKGAKVSAE